MDMNVKVPVEHNKMNENHQMPRSAGTKCTLIGLYIRGIKIILEAIAQNNCNNVKCCVLYSIKFD